MRILVIAAHPDDEVLGCGGTIARLARENHDIHIAILGEGITSRYDDRSMIVKSDLERLREHSKKAASVLGATNLEMFDLQDNRFDTLPLLRVVKIIEQLLDEFQPEAIYTQHGGDLNINHSVFFRATLTAARPIQGQVVKAIYGYEVPSSTDWSFQSFSPVFSPNLFVDITNTIDLKIEAMKAYQREVRTFPHPRSPRALRATAMHWGSVTGLQAAEAFEVIREIKTVEGL